MKYIIDEFADIKILRFLVPEFDNLSKVEKEYAYYLGEAAKWGRDITWLQFNKNNLFMRRALENIINTYDGEKDSNYDEFLVYTKRFFFSYGFRHHYGKHKFFPNVSIEYFRSLFNNSNKDSFYKKNDQTFDEFREWILDMFYKNEPVQKDLLLDCDVDFYYNISEKEAKKYYDNLNNIGQLSYGLNSKLINDGSDLREEYYKKDGMYGELIEKIVLNLQKALEVTQNDYQKNYTNLLIKYYETGDLKLWDDYNISWVKDIDSNVDYVNGFIEVYDDPIGIKGTWEAIVDIKDTQTTKITNIISSNAQWFEDNSPIDEKFKKKTVQGIKAKAIHAIMLGGGCYPSSPIGINLPNSDWIREEYGSKSVSITNLIDAYNIANDELPNSIRQEFIYSKEEFELEKQYVNVADSLHTHLHECLGHGSGKTLSSVPSNALKEYGSTLEEARADIFSLYYMADQKLIDLGLIPNFDLAKAYYNSYVRNGLQGQLVRVELGKNIVESHMQARKIISTWAYEKGFLEKVIERKCENGKTYFIVNNFEKLRLIFKDLLIELQRIKSTGDYEAGRELVLKYGIEVDRNLHEETLKRYAKLNLKPYSGFVNPNIVFDGENYNITYSENFLEQNLYYGKEYSI